MGNRIEGECGCPFWCQMEVIIFFDGLCEPSNPSGHGCCGWIIWRGKKKSIGREYVGINPTMTNNIAEYCALGFALKELAEDVDKNKVKKLTILGDSQLVINQLNKEWKCNKEHLVKLRDRCLALLDAIGCEDWVARWIPREVNEDADKLSREAYNLAEMRAEEGAII